MTDGTLAERRKHFFGHPAGLFVLFFAEMWERFSYYGMRALLVLYMTHALMFTDNFSYGVYGAYTSLVYATPIVGGFLADKILGFKRAVILGGILMVLGHATMALDQTSLDFLLGGLATATGATGLQVVVGSTSYVVDTTAFLYTALAFLILGNGFFKPNISSMVGRLYDDEDAPDSKRDGGFTIFYMGINVGAFLSGIACGYIGENWGWHYGFGLAAIGMIAGLVMFVSLQKWLYGHGQPPASASDDGSRPNPINRKVFGGLNVGQLIYGGAFLAVPLVAMLVSAQGIMKTLLAVVGVLVLLYLLWIAFEPEFEVRERSGGLDVGTHPRFRADVGRIRMVFGGDPVQRDRMFVILVLIIFTTTFWSFFEQAGSSLTLFADRNVNRHVLGWEIPTSAFQSVNPAFIILLAPVFAWLWQSLGKAKLEPRTPVKFGLGLLQLAAGFGVLLVGVRFFGADGRVPMIFLVLSYLLQTTGELSLSPVGLSKVTQLAPKKLVGVVMGAWFLSSSFANYIASIFAKLASAPEGASMKAMAAADTLPVYADLFLTIALVAAAVGVVCLLASPLIKKGMHGVH